MGPKACLAIGCASVAIALSSPVYAQDEPAKPAPQAVPDSPQQYAGDIVVTAQKREQRLNDVGMSITAVSGKDLAAQGVTEVSQLAKVEPSLQFSPSNLGTPVYTIRGVGYFEQSLAATPAVSIYQDEVPFTYPVMTRGAMMDVERVEILKGPQGTLYGQNATGGLVNFIAAKPTDTPEMGMTLGWSRFNLFDVSAYASGPLTDTLRVRVAGQTQQGGAWQRSVTRGEKLGDKNLRIGRLLLDWEPTAGFRAHLNVNGWTDHSELQAGQLIGYRFLNPQYISPVDPSQPGSYLPNPVFVSNGTYPSDVLNIIGNPIPPRNDRAADWDANNRPLADDSYWQAALRLQYPLTDDVDLTSISAYQRFRENDRRDVDGIAANNQLLIIKGDVESYYQELRLSGTMHPVSWIIGANYAHDTTHERVDAPDVLLTGSYLTGGGINSVLPSPPFAPWRNYFYLNDVTAKTLSAFANVDINFTDRLIGHAGIRYTASRQRMSGCTGTSDPNLIFFLGLLLPPGKTAAQPGGCTTFLEDGSQGLAREKLNETNVPFQVGLDFKPADDKLLYVTVRRGFKAGTAPALVPTSYVQRIPITQESLLAYEVGFKFGLADRQVQLNGAAFHYDYSDKQLLGRVIDPTGIFGALQALVNIPKSRLNGLELSADVRPRALAGFSLSGSATYLDSKVTSNFVNYASYVADASDTVNFRGEPYPYTPKWTVQAGARYEFDIGGDLRAELGANYRHQTGMTAAFGAVKASAVGPSLLIDPYGLLDLNAGLGAADGAWRVNIWGRNVTNEYYWNSAYYQTDTSVRYTGMPATYGLTVSFHVR